MAKKSETQKTIDVALKPLDLKLLKVNIVGHTPLLMDKMSDEVLDAIVKKQSGVEQGGKKKVRDLKKETNDAVHKTLKGKVGFPAYGFKNGMMECTSFLGDKMFSKKMVSGAIRIANSVDGLIPIKFKSQDVLQHNIGAQTKFTPQFHDWSATIDFRYNASVINPQDIITLLNYAGFHIGVGAWRPKCAKGGSGEFGTYGVSKK